MSDETANLPAKAKKKVSPRVRLMVLDIVQRKRVTDRVDYGALAAKHGVHAGTLRRLWFEWRNGLLDLGPDQSPEEQRFNAIGHEREKLAQWRRYERLLLVDFTRSLNLAEDLAAKGANKKEASWEVAGCNRIARELLKASDGIQACEKGYAAALDEEAQARKPVEKPMGPAVAHDVQTTVVAVSEEQRALELLEQADRERHEKAGDAPPE